MRLFRDPRDQNTNNGAEECVFNFKNSKMPNSLAQIYLWNFEGGKFNQYKNCIYPEFNLGGYFWVIEP